MRELDNKVPLFLKRNKLYTRGARCGTVIMFHKIFSTSGYPHKFC